MWQCQWTPPRSDQSRSVCPHPIAIPFYFSLAGKFFFLVWAMGRGQASSKKKRRNSNTKPNFKIVPSFILSYWCSWLKEIKPSASASGNSARATSAYCRWRHFTRNGSNLERWAVHKLKCPPLVGERILLSPAVTLNPSPVFISTFVVSLSLLNSELQQHRGTRPLVMATLAELPEAQNANALDPPTRSRAIPRSFETKRKRTGSLD